MSDLGKYLPLSARPRRDESGVSSNWSSQVGRVALALADWFDEEPDTVLDLPSMRPAITVGATAVELVGRLESSRSQRVRDRAAAFIGSARERPSMGRAEISSRLRSIAIAAMAPRGRRRIGDLTAAVVAAVDMTTAAGSPLPIDKVATGAVAVARSLTAPIEIRAVLAQRTLVATDAGWRVGRGRELEGSAAALILFLFGRTGLPGG
jgi:hypothetical protein